MIRRGRGSLFGLNISRTARATICFGEIVWSGGQKDQQHAFFCFVKNDETRSRGYTWVLLSPIPDGVRSIVAYHVPGTNTGHELLFSVS